MEVFTEKAALRSSSELDLIVVIPWLMRESTMKQKVTEAPVMKQIVTIVAMK